MSIEQHNKIHHDAAKQIANSGVGTMGTGGTLYPPSSGLVSPVPPKSKMRLTLKFLANDFNYKIV